MITKEEYLKAKSKFIEAKEICRLYKLQPKEKYVYPKKTFTLTQKKEFVDYVFKIEKFINYEVIRLQIQDHFSVGVNISKKILTELKNEGLIYKSEKRGVYEKNNPN